MLVDDQRSIREGLRAILEPDSDLRIVGTASDGYTAIEQVEILRPDVVLIDMEMPGLSGLEASKIICHKLEGIKILVLSMHDNEEYIAQSLAAGVSGYLLKNTPAHQLREAIRFVHTGHIQKGPEWFEEWVTGPATNRGPAGKNGYQQSAPPISSTLSQPSPLEQNKSNFPFNFDLQDLLLGIPTEPRPSKLLAPQIPNRPAIKYLALGLVGNILVWAVSIIYLVFTPPVYTSQWTITLPGAGSSARVDLPGVGQATSENESPYRSQASDPRENYKSLALTDELQNIAAAQAKIPLQEFQQPRVQILLNSTLMKFEIQGQTAEAAQRKAYAFHTALGIRLDQLRKQEVTQSDKNLETTLAKAKLKLNSARQKLTQFQTSSGLDSSDQIRDLSINIEQLRRQNAEATAQLKQVAARFQGLSQDLNLSSQEANDAFVLEADPLFQQYKTNASQANAALATLSSRLNANHPDVLNKQEEKNAAETALVNYGRSLLGRPVTQATLRKLSLKSNDGSDSKRGSLFQDLISTRSEQQGLQRQTQELNQQIEQFEAKLKTLSQQNGTLVRLQRDVQIAEAVFSSTLARLDLSQASLSASYPPIAIIAQPSLPKAPSAPKPSYVLLGAVFGSLWITVGILIWWFRSRRGQRLNRHV
ncbi:MAG: response regulator [Acaryochloridaceae cyanobacterium SU_2_1]|nr:response regulator [Acaryochloridaceae cyanobacterium SU_2_1]